MKKLIRLCSLLMVMLLLAGLLPTALAGSPAATAAAEPRVFTAADEARLEQDIFAKIDAVIDNAAQKAGGRERLNAADYCALLPRVREAVERSESYAPGSLRQNGSFLTWETKEGFACCFDPRMEALRRDCPQTEDEAEAAAPDEEPEALLPADPAQPEGGSPSSPRIGLIQPFLSCDGSYMEINFQVYGPVYAEMLDDLCRVSGGTPMRFDAKTATIDNVALTMESCGLVMFESHGVTDYYDPQTGDETSQANVSYLVLTTPRGLTDHDFVCEQGLFGEYYHALIGHGTAYVSGRCISWHMEQDAPHSLLYMGICSGMATEGIFVPLRERGVETVWGYSQPVYFIGDGLYMEAVLSGVCQGKSFAEAVAAAKRTYGNWDPVFQDYTEMQCVEEQVAFPITVSSEDPWPGRDGINAVQRVRSSWKLLNSDYTVRAVADDPAHGSVSVNANHITAFPAEGWRVSGARVLHGSAELRQDGDVFVVTPSSDCTVEVQFTQKAPVSIRCMVGDTLLCTLETLEGDPVALPEATPEVVGWTLLGWSEERVGLTDDFPPYTAPGEAFSAGEDLCLYALYGKTLPGEAEVYRLLTEAPESWEGDYVISSTEHASGACVLCGLQGPGTNYGIYENHGYEYLEDSGILVDEDMLRNVTDPYVFSVTAVENGRWAFRSKACGTYLANSLGKLVTAKNCNSASCRWQLGFNGGLPLIKCPGDERYNILAFDRGFGFFFYESALDTLRLWKREAGPLRLCASDPCGPFDDVTVEQYWYEAVDWAYAHSPRIANGTEPRLFRPRNSCTRAQIVSFLWRAAGEPEPQSPVSPFSDVTEERYYYKAVLWAAEQGITVGTGDGRFSPSGGCSRAEAVSFLWRFAGSPAPQTQSCPFTDLPAEAYYRSAVLWAAERGITVGTGDGRFSPSAGCTRGQIVSFLYRLLG